MVLLLLICQSLALLLCLMSNPQETIFNTGLVEIFITYHHYMPVYLLLVSNRKHFLFNCVHLCTDQ